MAEDTAPTGGHSWTGSLAVLADLLDVLPDASAVADAAGRIVSVTAQCERMFGYGRGELVGQPIEVLVPDRSRALHERHRDTYMAQPRKGFMGARLDRYSGRRKGGTEIDVDVMLAPIPTPQGTAVVAVLRDVTQRRRAEARLRELEERFHTAVETMLDCFGFYSAVRDASGRIVDFRIEFVNRAACAAHQMTREEQVGRTLLEIHPDHEGSGLFGDYCQVVETGEPLVREDLTYDEGRVAGGTEVLARAVDIQAVRLADGLAVCWRDVSERKRAQEAMQEASRVMQEAEQLKNTFLRAVSHDLRSPLATILHAIEMLKESKERLSDEQSKRLIDIVASNALRWRKLLDDLLDVDRLTRAGPAAELTREAVDLTALIREVAGGIELKDHALTVDVERIELMADRIQIGRILENLLTNAVKHTPPGTAIWVRANAERSDVLIAVEDAGPGVPNGMKHAVFEAFRRGDTAHGAGTGIGLSLVVEFARLHGGRAWVEDRPGGGASFRVLLPAEEDGS